MVAGSRHLEEGRGTWERQEEGDEGDRVEETRQTFLTTEPADVEDAWGERQGNHVEGGGRVIMLRAYGVHGGRRQSNHIEGVEWEVSE